MYHFQYIVILIGWPESPGVKNYKQHISAEAKVTFFFSFLHD